MPNHCVTIGMPVYNGERFLPRALETILDQDFEDFEVVVSDNGSSDGTVAIVEKFAALDSRVRYEAQELNRGAAWNFNRVIQMADPRSRYFAWAAADDEHAPDFLTRTVAILDADPSVVLAHTGTADIDEDGVVLQVYDQPVQQLTSHDPAVRIRDLVTMRHECFQAFGLMRADAVRSTRGLGAFADSDNVFLVEMALRGRFVQDDAVAFFRRQHPDRSMVAFADRRKRIAWFDPASADRLVFPFWRSGAEMLRAIRDAPLTREERRACYRSMQVFVECNWPGLVKNAVRSAVEAPPVLSRRVALPWPVANGSGIPVCEDTHDEFQPVRICELDLAHGVGELPDGTTPDDSAYGSARVLIRLHGVPLGLVTLQLPCDAAALAATIERELGDRVADHLREDGASPALGVRAAGTAVTCRTAPAVPVDPPTVSVVVCTLARSERDLAACLTALQRIEYPRLDVLVVDNSPMDPSTASIVAERAAADPRVRLVNEPIGGLSRARNTGMRFARGEIVAFTDDDAVVDSRWVLALVDAFSADPRVACVTGMTLAAELDTWEQKWFDEHGGFRNGFEPRVYDLEDGGDSSLFPYQLGLLGSGVNMAFRKGALGQGWCFDVSLGAGSLARGGEDLDAFLDVLLAGRRIAYRPDAVVWHRHRSDYQELRSHLVGYGTGLGAVLTKRALVDRTQRTALLRRVPAGVRHALRPGARTRPSPGPTGRLARAELAGMALGPLAYLRSRSRLAWLTA